MSYAEIRAALTDNYLAKRPSFARAQARCAAAGLELDRETYTALMSEIKQLRALLKVAKVDIDKHVVDHLIVNSWGNKDNPNFQVKAKLHPVADKQPIQAKFRKPKINTSRARGKGGMDVLFMPDLHVGFRNKDGALEPMHDVLALEVFINVLAHFKPDVCWIMGDFLDFAGFSSFRKSPDIRHLVTVAVQEAHDIIVRMIEASPHTKFRYKAGNHEERIEKHIDDHAPELSGLRRANDKRSITSIEHLLRLDELGVEYVGPYRSHAWHKHIRVLHGELIGGNGGETASKMLNAYTDSSVCGHVHRLELAYKTRHEKNGPVTTWAMSCGTLARIDGSLPGAASPDWQQGFGVLWPGDQPAIYHIINGQVHVNGVTIVAALDLSEEEENDGEE